VDENLVRYGSPKEALAHRLLGDSKTSDVKITKLHEIVGEGIEIHGELSDKQAKRSYLTSFKLDLEGRSREATCTCPSFRRSGMREGPCEHLLALRIAYARRRSEEESRRKTPEGRRLIRAETRTLLRREASGNESIYRISLDDRVVRFFWGQRGPTEAANDNQLRQQRLWFDSDREARDAYFARLETLASDGYIDADAF
jgi:uncharacterized Zn finger protein